MSSGTGLFQNQLRWEQRSDVVIDDGYGGHVWAAQKSRLRVTEADLECFVTLNVNVVDCRNCKRLKGLARAEMQRARRANVIRSGCRAAVARRVIDIGRGGCVADTRNRNQGTSCLSYAYRGCVELN